MGANEGEIIGDRQDELDKALGFMVGRAAMAEFFLNQTIQKLINSPYGSLVTASLSASGALDVIKRIVDQGNFGSEASDEVKKFVDASRIAFAERNKYVHGLRVIGGADTADQVYVPNRRRGGINTYDFEVDELRRLGKEFGQIAGAIFHWMQVYVEGKPPFRQEEKPNSNP